MILSDKALKLLRLALSEVNPHEAASAAVMFMAELRREGITAERFEGSPVPKGFTRVKREDARPAASMPHAGQSASQDIQTPSRTSQAPKNNSYGAYEEEQLQWVYENRHRLSKKMAAAVVEEMEARGLI